MENSSVVRILIIVGIVLSLSVIVSSGVSAGETDLIIEDSFYSNDVSHNLILETTSSNAGRGVVADLNGDGLPDLIEANSDALNRYYLNRIQRQTSNH